MKPEILRKLAGREEIDYQFLISILSEYSRPRDKISEWLKSGNLVRIKKGLYVFGPEIALAPYSLEVLANLIYGPSAISLTYALSFYGFIPERVTTVTSITNKKNKTFSTPAGDFTYQYLNVKKYPIEITLYDQSEKNHFLIATPEKALCDQLVLTDKAIELQSLDDIDHYLLQDLRIDESALNSLHLNKIKLISNIYKNEKLILLTNYLKKWKKS